LSCERIGEKKKNKEGGVDFCVVVKKNIGRDDGDVIMILMMMMAMWG